MYAVCPVVMPMAEAFPFLAFLAAVLLAAPAGLNPYLPVMIVAVIARFSGFLRLAGPFGFLGETWFMLLAGALFLANVFLDKMFLPGDSLATPVALRSRRTWVGVAHDLSQVVLGSLGAALLMAATNAGYPFFPANLPLIPPMLGILLAALVYFGKRSWRHRWARRWGPFANMLLSTAEDLVVVLVCLPGLLLLR
jgi:hypothetical protein